MELLFVLVISAGLGAIVPFIARHGRETYGYLLVPAISTAVTAVVWVVMLWLGQTFDGGWIWLVSLVFGPAVALIVVIRLPRSRATTDRAMLTRLSGGKA